MRSGEVIPILFEVIRRRIMRISRDHDIARTNVFLFPRRPMFRCHVLCPSCSSLMGLAELCPLANSGGPGSTRTRRRAMPPRHHQDADLFGISAELLAVVLPAVLGELACQRGTA